MFNPNIDRLEKNRNTDKLIKCLQHEEGKIRVEAAEALRRLNALPASKPILNAWSSGKIGTNPSVVWVIKQTQDAKALQEVIRQLKHWKSTLLSLSKQRLGPAGALGELFLSNYLSNIVAL